MNFEKFTVKFQQALADAQSLAIGRDHNFIETAHVLVALLEQEGGLARSLFQKINININQLRASLNQIVDTLPKVTQMQKRIVKP
jgi:ATP-dependent Clp protease ATP-binding subunit ClpB